VGEEISLGLGRLAVGVEEPVGDPRGARTGLRLLVLFVIDGDPDEDVLGVLVDSRVLGPVLFVVVEVEVEALPLRQLVGPRLVVGAGVLPGLVLRDGPNHDGIRESPKAAEHERSPGNSHLNRRRLLDWSVVSASLGDQMISAEQYFGAMFSAFAAGRGEPDRPIRRAPERLAAVCSGSRSRQCW
jgi:hypothetical protein